jgi:hypothetical protein
MKIKLLISILCWSIVSLVKGQELTRCNSFNSAANTWAAVAAGAVEPIPLYPLKPIVLMPDGSEFRTWEQKTECKRTFYVAQFHPHASDSNPGTQELPWKTINRAATILEPGDRVVVSKGIYREWVRPVRGGTGPDRMIAYEATPGEEVIISGAEVFKGTWHLSAQPANTGSARIWVADLPGEMFPYGNPFAKINIDRSMMDSPYVHKSWSSAPPYILKQGLVFQDGERLRQTLTAGGLNESAGTYWVEPDGKRVHVRPYGDKDTNSVCFEFTTRPHVFASEKAGLGFVSVKGFTIQHVASCFPVPHKGAVSVNQGHHWIIEGNTVKQVNALGIDCGRRQTFIPYDVPEDTPELAGVGHIIRNNRFLSCGVCSFSGLGLIGCLFEGNYSEGCGWQRCGELAEAGGIKLLYLKHSLVRRNIVTNTIDAAGIWIDHSNVNSRISENVVYGGRGSGAIFLEASYIPNLIDNNIVWNYNGNAFFSLCCSKLTVVNNLFGSCTKQPVEMRPSSQRVLDVETHRPSIVYGNLIMSNIFYGFGEKGPEIPDGNLSDWNLFVNPPDSAMIDLDKWKENICREKNSYTFVSKMGLSPNDLLLKQKPVLEPFRGVRIFEVTTDFFGSLRPPEITTPIGPFLPENVKQEMVLKPVNWP